MLWPGFCGLMACFLVFLLSAKIGKIAVGCKDFLVFFACFLSLPDTNPLFRFVVEIMFFACFLPLPDTASGHPHDEDTPTICLKGM